MSLSPTFWLTIIAYAVSIGALYGGLTNRLKHLENKVDTHNHLVKRMYEVEARLAIIEKGDKNK